MWDAGIRKEVAEMKGENPAYPVDVSPGLTTTRAHGTLRTGSDSLARSNMTNWSLESGSPQWRAARNFRLQSFSPHF